MGKNKSAWVAVLVAVVAIAVVGVSLFYWFVWTPQASSSLGTVGGWMAPYGAFPSQAPPYPPSGCCRPWWGYALQRLPTDEVKERLESYLTSLGPNYGLMEVMEFTNYYYAVVYEKDTGIGAFEVLVDPYTGAITPEPGPNMMWNTKYGMHGRGMMGGWIAPTAYMPVTPEQAERLALAYLQRYFRGSIEVEEPKRFYGYYTMDFKWNNQTYGMLSINGYTGQAWMHTWHGKFIQEIELEAE